jgi:hypothetical protein
MAAGSNGHRAALGRGQLMQGLISSLSGTAGLLPFISFSTSYPECCECSVQRLEPVHAATPALVHSLGGSASS